MRAVAAVPLSALLSVALAGCGAGSPRATTSETAALAPSGLGQQFVSVVKWLQPSVVQIRTQRGLGSGVVFDASGSVVPNAHVLAGGGDLAVTLADGRQYAATLVGSYVPDDLAAIRIAGAPGLSPAQFADSSRLSVGEVVLAAGNPLGLQSSITDGIVSALGRTVVEGGGVVLSNVIQTSAAINPGNSGGALVNLAAQVIGIPTVAAVNPQLGTTAAGIGFAIPSNTVRDVASQIIAHGHVIRSHRAALGAHYADGIVASGALVTAVQARGPAAGTTGATLAVTLGELPGA